jgi:hypothetical protein
MAETLDKDRARILNIELNLPFQNT